MRFWCKCGKAISNTMCPNDVELRVYTDKEWDMIIDMEVKDMIDIPFPKYEVWRCPTCERIYVFDGNKVIRRYILEDTA